jgi:hypothetical protein
VNNEIFAVWLASVVVDASPACAQTRISGDMGAQRVDVPSSLAPVDTLILGRAATRFGIPNFSPGTLSAVAIVADEFSGFVTVGHSGIGARNHFDVN